MYPKVPERMIVLSFAQTVRKYRMLKNTETDYKTRDFPISLHINIPRFDPPAFVDEFISPFASLLLIFVVSFFIAS